MGVIGGVDGDGGMYGFANSTVYQACSHQFKPLAREFY